MEEADLQFLVEEGTIISYEIVEQDDDGKVLQFKFKPFPTVDRIVLSAMPIWALGRLAEG